MTNKTLKIFIKNPQLGNVKTRLAKSVGSKEALNIYKKLLIYTKSVSLGVKANREVWYSSLIEEFDIWDTNQFIKKLQSGANLGDRMAMAIQESFKNNKGEKVVLIGSDCAEITTKVIEKAFTMLDENEVVIGTANDGGYYLIGMKNYYPELFTEIEWSTTSVLNQTLSKIKKDGLSYVLLEALNDVDTLEDWNKVKERIKE